MQETIIRLEFRVKDFREVYYRKGRGNIFVSPKTRLNSWLTILFVAAAIAFYFLSVRSGGMALVVPLVLCIIATVFLFIQLLVNIVSHFQWKRAIDSYLREAAAYQSNSIVVNESCIEFINDSEINTEHWHALKAVNIQPSFISMTGSMTNYLLPAKSMQPDEFSFLTGAIKEKVGDAVLTNISQPEDTIEA